MVFGRFNAPLPRICQSLKTRISVQLPVQNDGSQKLPDVGREGVQWNFQSPLRFK